MGLCNENKKLKRRIQGLQDSSISRNKIETKTIHLNQEFGVLEDLSLKVNGLKNTLNEIDGTRGRNDLDNQENNLLK